MKKREPFSFFARLRSIGHALFGLRDMILTEHNAWLHLFATVVALDLAWWLDIRGTDLAIVILAIAVVWIAESFNTVLEIMANLVVGQRYSRIVKRAKDIAAGAVLIACVVAICIAFLIFGEPLYQRLSPFFG